MSSANIPSANTYKAILHTHTDNKTDIDTAMKLTGAFIHETQCILSGGMAIDAALRLKNSLLYEEEVMPDYDPWSDNHLELTEKLAQILCLADLKDVSVSNATHISTRVVNVGIARICEMTHIPTNIYAKIPTILYNGILIRHPHHQLIDMLMSISCPLTEYPRENYMARLDKDIVRFNKVIEHYPFDIGVKRLSDMPATIREFEVPEDWGEFCVAGVACIAGITGGVLAIVGRTIQYAIPGDMRLLLLVHKLPDAAIIYQNGYLDSLPATYRIDDILVAVDIKDVSCNTVGDGVVTNGYYELAHMLINKLHYSPGTREHDVYACAFDTLYTAIHTYEKSENPAYGSPLTVSGQCFWSGINSLSCVLQMRATDDVLHDLGHIKYRPDRVAFKENCDLPPRASVKNIFDHNDYVVYEQ